MMKLSKAMLGSISFMAVWAYSNSLNASSFSKFNRGTDEFTFIYKEANISLHTYLSDVPRPLLYKKQLLNEQKITLPAISLPLKDDVSYL